MKTKLLVIGPNSTHVVRFIHLVKNLFDYIIFVGENHITSNDVTRQHLVNFRSKNPFTIWKNYKILKKIIQSENPDITHIQQVNRVAFMAARSLFKLKKKYVVTAWGSDVLLIPTKSALYKKMTQFVLNNSETITADSADMISAITKLAPDKITELIFFGVEPLKSLPKEKIIFSNRALFELYNINKVILEFYEFQKNYPDWKLIIAGTGEKSEQLKMLVDDLKLTDKIDFVGWLNSEKNNDYYRRAAIYISFPSSDGTSVSLLEAMSAGCIPVVSDLPVAYEWIESGKNGVIKNKLTNALSDAVKLNFEAVEKINSALIDRFATGKIATEKFRSIYTKLKNDSTDKK